jgi:hypothetical protein
LPNLQDKKGRLYIITALSDTIVDLKVLSARLGLGKGGLRFAPDELLSPTLGVALGSVTPLAVSSTSASHVLVLLDDKIRKTSSLVYVHPMVNTASLAMTARDLECYLASYGREALWIDLEANPKIDKDNPADLKHYAESVEPSSVEETAGLLDSAGPPTSKCDEVSIPQKKKTDGKLQGSANDAVPQARVKSLQGRGTLNVDEARDRLLRLILDRLGISLEDRNRETIAKLGNDLEVELNSLRNAAYTTGFKNARSSTGYL